MMNSNDKMMLINKMKSRNLIGSRIISFFGGAHFFVNLSLNIFLKDTLHLEPVDIAKIRFFQSLPWTIRPLYGLMTDLISVCGYRQKPYFILLFLINSISWIILSTNVHSPILLQVLFVIIQFTLAFIGVVNRVIITETGRLYEDVEKKTKENITRASTTLQVGRFVASLCEGFFAQNFKAQTVFLCSSLLPVLVFIGALLIIEKDSRISEEDIFFSFNSKRSFKKEAEEEMKQMDNTASNASNFNQLSHTKDMPKADEDEKDYFKTSQTEKIIKFITNKNVYMPLIFVILYNSLPSSQNAIFFYSMNSLNITTQKMGYLSIMINLAVIFSMIFYNRYLSHVSWPIMITITTLLNFLVGLLFIPLNLRISVPYVSDYALICFISCATAVCYQYGFIPFLYFASIIAPRNLRGTGTSFVITCWNFGLTLSEISNGLASKSLGITSTSFERLYLFVLIEKCGKVVMLLLLCFVNLDHSAVKHEKRRANSADSKSNVPMHEERLSHRSHM